MSLLPWALCPTSKFPELCMPSGKFERRSTFGQFFKNDNIKMRSLACTLSFVLLYMYLMVEACLADKSIIMTRMCGNDVTRPVPSLDTIQVRSPSECALTCSKLNHTCLAINFIPESTGTASGECQILSGILPATCYDDMVVTRNGRYYERDTVSTIYTIY